MILKLFHLNIRLIWMWVIINNKVGMSENDLGVTFKSAPNIALVKYWGKFNQSEILPINDSIGLTLNTDDICTTTSVTFTKQTPQDTFLLNNKQTNITNRMLKVLGKVRERARTLPQFSSMHDYEWRSYHFRIESHNSFPSASGMASSASGYSCLAAALNHLFGGIFKEEELSRLARSGSGSAARALYGGLVKWCGVDESYLSPSRPVSAEQLQAISKKCISFPTNQCSELSFIKIIALITQNKEKDVSSTSGMKTSTETSQFIKYRNQIANSRIQQMGSLITAINQARKLKNKEQEYRDFSQFAELVIKDSNSFHSVCLDTYPPIFYLNQFSKHIISMVDRIINRETKQTKVAYTFDAGPHGFLFVHEDMLDTVLTYLHRQFGSREEVLNSKARAVIAGTQGMLSLPFSNYGQAKIVPRGIWLTDVGRGPQQVK